MRPRRASVSNGVVNRPMRLSPQAILLAVLAVIGFWMVGSLVQEVSLDRSLSHQAGQLRDQNAAIAATNQDYQRDIAAVSSGAAAEEEARRDGYARSDEHLYIIATPPPPPAAPPSRQHATSLTGPAAVIQAVWHFLTRRSG